MSTAQASGLDATHDPALQSWVESANDPATDFPIQNLPLGRFRLEDDADWRIGVAIGSRVLDLRAAGLIDHCDMNRLMRLLPEARRGLRQAISEGLRTGSPRQNTFQAALHAQSSVEMGLPCQIGDYTDFYTSVHHATTIGRQMRPDNPLLPNYKWVPIGYHGRASTVVVSGTPVRRPHGQLKPDDAESPVFGPCKLLDYELEMGFYVGRGNALGSAIPIAEAGQHIFGFSLVNDWSARDIQKWEYQPLGPFLAKSFATSVSPWVVPWEALQPYRCAPDVRPEPLPYLTEKDPAAFDIRLEVWLNGELLSESNFRHMFWTVTQMLAHHASNGCEMRPGDLLASGTVSGPSVESAGCLLELGWQGPGQPRSRPFLQDGDEVTLRGYCVGEGLPRLSFGECSGKIRP